jgi:hypothetical protein
MGEPKKLQRWEVGEDIDRYGNEYEYQEKYDDGKWVLYEDAQAEIDRLQKEVDRLTEYRENQLVFIVFRWDFPDNSSCCTYTPASIWGTIDEAEKWMSDNDIEGEIINQPINGLIELPET